MDGPKVIAVGIIALLVGLLIGWLFWGQRAKELDAVKGRLAEVERSAAQEGAMATKVRELEARLEEATERLDKERKLREELEAIVTQGKK